MADVKAILFDAGGVILDESEREDFCATTISFLISTYLTDYSVEDYWNDVKIAVDEFYPSVYGGILKKYLGDNQTVCEQVRQEFLNRLTKSGPPLKLMNGFTEELIDIHRSYKTAIAGQYGGELLDLLEKEELLRYFTFQYTQDDFSITKPDSQYYKMIADKIGVKPESCLMVGDRIDNDIKPAKTLGMKTILIRSGIHKNQKSNDPLTSPDGELSSVVGIATKISELCLQSNR
jgi:FMN phosphatase YigB (HAD superfamily)